LKAVKSVKKNVHHYEAITGNNSAPKMETIGAISKFSKQKKKEWASILN
jgi:hypothetical protein